MRLAPTLALMCAAVLHTACVSTPPSPATPPPLSIAKPMEDMEMCKINTCLLPEWFDKSSEEDQAAIEGNCWVVNAWDARECARKHKHLVDHINGGP